MSAKFTFDEIVKGMTDLGIPRAQAERQARHECGIPSHFAEVSFVLGEPVVALPLRITLPWSALCSDNIHEKASLTMRNGKPVPRRVLDARYKLAAAKTRAIAKEVTGGCTPISEPLAIHVRVYLPGGSSRNDAINFSKCAHDALQGVVYTNDRWLYDVHWVRAGIDVDAPRAEITISALPL